MFMFKKHADSIMFTIFFIIGIFLFPFGIYVSINTFNYDDKIETTATITDIISYENRDGEISYEVYVEYFIDGQRYESELNGYLMTFSEGDKINIYYDINNPRVISTKSLDLLVLIVPFMGIIFVLIGALGIKKKIKQRRQDKYIEEHGELIYATYVETIVNYSYAVNDEHPYQIVCEWTDPTTNIQYTFKSKNLWRNPEIFINMNNIESFPVYVDKNDKQKYLMDTDGYI